MKKIISAILCLSLTFSLCSSAFATNAVIPPNEITVTGHVPLSELCEVPDPALTGQSETARGSKSQTKDVYAESTYIGTITLHYDAELRGGRPQFIYDTCEVTWDFRAAPAGYRVQSMESHYTNDYITINLVIQHGILIYWTDVVFRVTDNWM